MALLKWSSKYSVGVHSMDSQHTKLFDILNDLHEAMMKGQGQKKAGELLSKLLTYTSNHFTAEEALMAAAGYPALAQHRLQHQELIKQINDFAARYNRGEANLTLPLLSFLRDWLSNHIDQEDKLYGAALNKHIAS